MQDSKPRPDLAPEASRRHGGDLAEAAKNSSFSGAWLDVSTGINPWPYPLGATPASLATRLPDATLLARLRMAAARYYGAPGPDCVVAAPGSQSLIQLLPRLIAPTRVAVLAPTYNEHAPAWRLAGHEVVEVPSLEALDGSRVSILVATNPNNPDGKRLERTRLLDLATRLGARGGMLAIDEAFADTVPELSLASDATRPGLVVLRSFGKFFGLAGLRLGFALAEPAFAARIADSLGPWPVSGPAAWIAARAFADVEWIASTRQHLAAAATRLDAILRAGGLEILGGTSLYRLATSARAREIDAALRAHGIYARSFPERPDWLRFGLLPDAAGEARLATALASVAENSPSLIETEVSR
jgi:cobalamin biosynthetic protein CobC